MHVKYIVYYVQNQKLPCVDIWKTKGDMIHPIYAENHGIRPQNISSLGDLFFHKFRKKWILDHWQMDGAMSFKLKRRDKALVQKKIHETHFLKDENLQNQCQKISLFRRIFQND